MKGGIETPIKYLPQQVLIVLDMKKAERQEDYMRVWGQPQ